MFEDENERNEYDNNPRSSGKMALTGNSAVKAAIFVLGLMLCIIVIYVLILGGSNANPQENPTHTPNTSATATVKPEETPDATEPTATVVPSTPTPEPFSFKNGDENPKIKELQQLLINKGYLSADTELAETFGAKTEAAVKLFQTENGLEVTGIVDNALWAAIEAAPVREEPFELKITVTDEKVAQLQQLLMDKGFMAKDEPTTYFGAKTEEAVKLFQRVKGITETGIVNNTLYKMLQEAEPYTTATPS